MFKKIIILLSITIVTISSLTACKIKSKTDIGMRETVTVVGVDEVDGIITLTITLSLIQPTEAISIDSKVSIYTAEGSSMFEAIQKFHPYTDRIMFWGQVNYMIIGEDTAKLGINKYLDLFARDHEIKQNMKILVAQGMTANELIKVTDLKQSPLDDTLTSLFSDGKNISSNNEVSTLDYLQMISSDKSCLYLPSVKTTEKMEKKEKDEDKKLVMLDGYAIFKEDVLEGFVEGSMAKGMNWLINDSNAGYMTLYDKEGKIVVVELTGCKHSFEVNYDSKIPKVKIKVECTTNIVEYHGKEDIFTHDEIGDLMEQQNEIIENEVLEIVDYLQKVKIDVLGINDEIYHKYPIKTKDYEDIWPDIFAETDISVKAETTIDRTYNINHPVEYDENKDESKEK